MVLLCTLAVLGLGRDADAATQRESERAVIEQRLGSQIAKTVTLLLRQEPLGVEEIDIAALLIEEAANLIPEDPEIWRLAHAVAVLAEQEDLRVRALERIVNLDPADEVARLRWVSEQLREYQTAEELAGALEDMLTPESRQALGPAVSSHLALDLALLERRRGEDERFADRLAQAVALDPSNQHAAAVAAGYFQMHVDDPIAEGELLLHLLMANPVNIENAILFATHLLGHGAYIGAERFYNLALQAHDVTRSPAPPNLVADAAIAQFARGDSAGALRRLAERQRMSDDALQQHLQRTRSDISPRDRGTFIANLTPTFATVRAAIHARTGQDPGQQIEFAKIAYNYALEEVKERIEDPRERDGRIALLRLEQAWMLIWLGGNLDDVREALNEARSIAELSETAEQRFAGWEALRLGEYDRARSLLEPIASDDPPSRLGLAKTLIASDARRDGARELLAIARSQPGTLIGAFAADYLAELLGRRVPLSEETAKLEELARRFPTALDRIMVSPTTALSFSIVPSQSVYSPHEPIVFTIEIMNNSPIPLAIDQLGPIQPEIAILSSAQTVQARLGLMPPLIVGIDRRLRLMPRERLRIQIDLRRTFLGEILDRFALAGTNVRHRGLINFRALRDGSLVPTLLGNETSPASVRVEGVRLTFDWMEESQRHVAESLNTQEVDLTRVALFGLVVSGEAADQLTPEQRRMRDEARRVLAENFTSLDGLAQAWLLSVWPAGSFRELLSPQRFADDRLVRIVHLSRRVRSVHDPVLIDALQGEDPKLERLATLVRRVLQRRDQEGGLLAPLGDD